MVNFKETIIKLHKEFPEWDLNTLIKIMECIVEGSIPYTGPFTTYPTGVRDLNTITYTT